MGDSFSSGLPAHSVLHGEPSKSTTSLQSSSSPIGHLPDELLLEVFSYACCEHINVGRLREPIWDLQQVCVRWQRVVKSTPSLWSAFQVTTGDVHVDSIALRIQSCLKLSGENALSISLVHFPRINGDDDEDFPFKIYTDLPDHANRWESLVVDGDLLEHIVVHRPSVGSAVAKHGLSRLRKLVIIDSERYHYYLFCGASALKELKLFNPKNLPKPSDVFPWKNIEMFTLEDCKTVQSEKRLINAFRSMAKSLQVLIWKENDGVLHYVPDTVVTLSALHTLITKDAELEDWDPTPDEPVPLWNMFRMPALTDIRIVGGMDTSFDSLLSMVRLSGSVIKKLQFKECFPAYMLPSAAEALCDIEELILEDLRDPGEGIPMLVWNTTDSLMCSYAGKDVIKILPSLRKLEICDVCEDTGTILMDIMRSRSATAAESTGGVLSPLQSLKWMISDSLSAKASIGQKKCYGFDDDTVSQIKNLGNELGINVEVDLHWIP